MQEQLKKIQEEASEIISSTTSLEKLQEIHRLYLGKKGELTSVLKGLAKLTVEEKKQIGSLANSIKEDLQNKIKEKESELEAAKPLLKNKIDISLPPLRRHRGHLHPTIQMMYDLNDAFRSLNFEIYEGDLISNEAEAFDNLNFPKGHPARESMDTYWLDGAQDKEAEERFCMRPHLTGDSVKYLKEHGAPARIVYPGQVFRNETTDAGHDRAFFQYEALIIDKDFSFSSGLLLVNTILSKIFGYEVETRMRAGFFPFVEPGFEIDMRCQVCKGKGCKVCKNVGWIEVMPGGTPHPNVLKAAGLDPYEWTGFYINIGLDRLVMMRYGIDDVRLLHGNDLRFLKQFN